MDNKPTCGVMYLDALTRYTGGDPKLVRVFAAGFVNGQAEKVYLGACRAAMFRPSDDFRGMVGEIARDAANRYGLELAWIGGEGWIFRPDNRGAIMRMPSMTVNSPPWHNLRGWLCGVPANEIDLKFHTRQGYGEPCDVIGDHPR